MNIVTQSPASVAQQREIPASPPIFNNLVPVAAVASMIASGLIASQGLLAMGGLILCSEIIARVIERPTSRDIDPQLSSAAKVEHFTRRQFLASTIRICAFLGAAPVATWYTVAALLSGTTIFSATALKAAALAARILGLGLITRQLWAKAFGNINTAMEIVSKPTRYKETLSTMYNIIDMAKQDQAPGKISPELASIAKKYLKSAGKQSLNAPLLPDLQKSLERARQKGETLSPKVIAALLQIYQGRNRFNQNSWGNNADIDTTDSYKHLLPLVGSYDIEDFVSAHLSSLDLPHLSTYLSDEQFNRYFDKEKLLADKKTVQEWQQKAANQDWDPMEQGLANFYSKGHPRDRSDYERFVRLRDMLAQVQENGPSTDSRHAVLQDMKRQVSEIFNIIEHSYPLTDSCEELCRLLDEEKFRSYFLVDKLDQVEKTLKAVEGGLIEELTKLGWEEANLKIMGSLNNSLTRILIRLDTLPEQSGDSERLLFLHQHRERALKLREALLVAFPVLKKDCVALQEEIGVFSTFCPNYLTIDTTQGKIPVLDKEVFKRALFRLQDLPPISANLDFHQRQNIERLERKREAAEQGLKRLS